FPYPTLFRSGAAPHHDGVALRGHGVDEVATGTVDRVPLQGHALAGTARAVELEPGQEVVALVERELQRSRQAAALEPVAADQRGLVGHAASRARIGPQHVLRADVGALGRHLARRHRAPALHRLAVAHGHRVLHRLAAAGLLAAAPEIAHAVAGAVGQAQAAAAVVAAGGCVL